MKRAHIIAFAALAGFVPWAESGTRISFFSWYPCSLRYFRIMSTPANSPWAPAAGLSEKAFIPDISQSIKERS